MAKNSIPVYRVGDKFVKITKSLNYRLTDIDHCSTFSSLKAAKSWGYSIKKRYPTAELIQAGLIVK